MKKIKLPKGHFTIVDDEDFSHLYKYPWFLDKSNGYVRRSIYVCKTQKKHSAYMHRQILEHHGEVFLGRERTDHKNRNKLDNRKENLRIASPQGNSANRKKNKNNTSGFKGVYLLKDKPRTKPWKAYIKVNYKTISLGVFKIPLDASKAYNQAALKHFGEFARLNPL